MFESHFSLRENPFVSGHQPRFVFPSPEHQEALAHLRFGIENREPFVLITGEVGTGKTTALYDVLGEWKGRVHVALVNNSALTRSELLEEICLRFGFTLPPSSSKPQVLNQLERHLLAVHGRGERVILILDEAQNLDRDLLEEIRLLSNLESMGDKLLQVVLVGQPELEERLGRPELRQLRQRISVHYRLKPMTIEDTEHYIHHRISVAGGHATAIFPAESCRVVYDLSHGIPREINHICAQALLGAFVDESSTVRPEHVRAAAAEIEFKSVMRRDTDEPGEPRPAPAERGLAPEPGRARAETREPEPPRAIATPPPAPAPWEPIAPAPRVVPPAPVTPEPVPVPPAAAPVQRGPIPPAPAAPAPMTPLPAAPATAPPSPIARVPVEPPAWVTAPTTPAATPAPATTPPTAPAAKLPASTERERARAESRAAAPPSRILRGPDRRAPRAETPRVEHRPPPFVPPDLRPSPSTVEDFESENGSGKSLGWLLGIATLAVIAIAIVLAIRFGSREGRPRAGASRPAPSVGVDTMATARAPMTGTRDSSASARALVGPALDQRTSAHEPPASATAKPAVTVAPAAAPESARAEVPAPAPKATAPESAPAGKPASVPTKAVAAGAAGAALTATTPKTGSTARPATATATGGAKPAAPKPAGAARPSSPLMFGVAVGTYLDPNRAEAERSRLAVSTKMTTLVRTVTADSVSKYELVLGSYATHDEAERAASDLITRGVVDEARVVVQAHARTPH